MESIPSPDEAASLLNDAGRDRDRLAADLVLPAGYDVWLGAAVAIQLATVAFGVWAGSPAPLGILAAGVVLFVTVAAWQVWRFRRANGVLVAGFVSRAVLGNDLRASISYAAALAAAIGAGLHEVWWLVGVCAAAGGLLYVLSGRRWVRLYRGDPATHSRGESVLVLVVISLLAVVGLVLLLAAA
jgi:hypothetical protein